MFLRHILPHVGKLSTDCQFSRNCEKGLRIFAEIALLRLLISFLTVDLETSAFVFLSVDFLALSCTVVLFLVSLTIAIFVGWIVIRHRCTHICRIVDVNVLTASTLTLQHRVSSLRLSDLKNSMEKELKTRKRMRDKQRVELAEIKRRARTIIDVRRALRGTLL